MQPSDLHSVARKMGEGHPEVLLVYLFGSQVSGHTGPLSDYDLGVYLRREADVVRLRSELHHLAFTLLDGEQVDLVVLNGVPVELAFHVIATGRRLFERSTADRVEYEAYVMSRYGDYLPVLRRQRDEILNAESNEKRIQRYREALRRTERTIGPADGDR